MTHIPKACHSLSYIPRCTIFSWESLQAKDQFCIYTHVSLLHSPAIRHLLCYVVLYCVHLIHSSNCYEHLLCCVHVWEAKKEVICGSRFELESSREKKYVHINNRL